jgi:malate dehydrogenase (oxaloacetate-decarboxylating)
LAFQKPLAQTTAAIAEWDLADSSSVSLLDVVRNAKPSVLIGVTGVPGLFTEEVVRAMAAGNETPVILPLSNPTSRAEATAADVLAWTEGRALVATGSPFDPVTVGGVTHTVAQSNNSYIFPGVGLGVLASGARRVSDEMFMAAARALADAVGAHQPGDSLLPPLVEIRSVSRAIAIAVGTQAQRQGLAPTAAPADLEAAVERTMWQPEYRPFVAADRP